MSQLVRIMESGRSPAAVRVKAAKAILDIAMGPPVLDDWEDD